MTIAELEQYRTLKRQIEIFESDAGVSFISGVDTTRPSVQSGKVSNPTESVGLRLYELDCELQSEYKRVKDKFVGLNKYIAHIKDNEVREIAMRKFICGQNYEQIGEAMFCHRTTVKRKLEKYIKTKNAHNAH